MTSTAISSQLIQLQNSTTAAQAKETRSTDLDQDAFLELLMVQLKNQDPTSPMDTSEFMSQQAQFTTISEIQKLNSNLTESTVFSQASTLIGREVIATDSSAADGYVSGVVECASLDSDGNITYTIKSDQFPNGKDYPSSSISIIGDVASNDTSAETTSTDNN